MHLKAVYSRKMLNVLHLNTHENCDPCKEVGLPKLLECGTGDRAHGFTQQQKMAFLTVSVIFYALPLDFLLCLKLIFSYLNILGF